MYAHLLQFSQRITRSMSEDIIKVHLLRLHQLFQHCDRLATAGSQGPLGR